MKLKVNEAVAIFGIVNGMDPKKVNKKFVDIWRLLIPTMTQWDKMMEKKNKDAEPILKKYREQIEGMPQEERQKEIYEIDRKLGEEISELVSSKALIDFGESEVDIDFPVLSDEDLYAAKDSVEKMGQLYPLYKLVGE